MYNSEKSFSENYALRMQLQQASRGNLENHFQDWSNLVVTALESLFEDHTFSVLLHIVPNPSDMKGMDHVMIEVRQQATYDNDMYDGSIITKEFNKVQSNSRPTISQCIQDVNVRMDKLLEIRRPKDTIEYNGRTYKLVENK